MNKQAPFDADGNMTPEQKSHHEFDLEEGRWKRVLDTEMREVAPFTSYLGVVGQETGSKRFILQDDTGKTYPMFVADMVKLLQGVQFFGTWAAQQRGSNYGIKSVELLEVN